MGDKYYMKPTKLSRFLSATGLVCILIYFGFIACYGYEDIHGKFAIIFSGIGIFIFFVSKNFQKKVLWIEPQLPDQHTFLKKCRFYSSIGTLIIILCFMIALLSGKIENTTLRIYTFFVLLLFLLASMLMVGLPNYLYQKKYGDQITDR